MADPRTTGYLDYFNRPNEDPLSGGGIWTQTFSDRDPMTVYDNRATRREPHTSRRAYSHYTVKGFDDDVEAWGQRAELGYILGHQEILGLAVGADGGLSVGQWDGYALWSQQQVGANKLYLYRVDNGINTQLDVADNDDDWVLLRRNGNDVEGWAAPTGVDDWSLIVSATDFAYTTDLWLVLAEGDNNNSSAAQEGWIAFGGGHGSNRPQFYRWIKN